MERCKWLIIFVLGFLTVAGSGEELEPVVDEFSGKTVATMKMAMGLIEKRDQNAPKVGTAAPDFKLNLADGSGEIRLSSLWKQRPAVLVFGSITCDRTHRNAAGIRDLYSKFGREFQFIYVYIREAHAGDGWGGRTDSPRDPRSVEERSSYARAFCKVQEIGFTALVDSTEDQAAVAYAAWPARIYMVDQSGIVKFKGATGPWGFRPTEDSYFMNPKEHSGVAHFAPKLEEQISAEAFLSTYLKAPK